MNIAYSQAAAKQMTRLPGQTATALAAKVETYAAKPGGRHPWARWITGQTGMVRIRQGDYRALCEVDYDSQTLTVHAIGHRKEVYR